MTPQPARLRVATFNVCLNRRDDGLLLDELREMTLSPQLVAVAKVLRHIQPDIVLLNEFDYSPGGEAIGLFRQRYLEAELDETEPLHLPYDFCTAVNTGVPSGFDLNRDGKVGGAGDALGFGFFAGQYGMLLLSRYPIDFEASRTFRHFLWRDLPNAVLPPVPGAEGECWYSESELDILPLSSKSHWDVVVKVPDGPPVHVLAAHPVPPIADNSARRNARRNHDEIRFWAEYLNNADFIYDDGKRYGGLPEDQRFVILGDMNASPSEGDSYGNAITQLLDHPRVKSDFTPTSEGALSMSPLSRERSASHTARFRLRVDYALPSQQGFELLGSEVFWPTRDEYGFDWVGMDEIISSDHRLVWLDVNLNA